MDRNEFIKTMTALGITAVLPKDILKAGLIDKNDAQNL